MVLVGTVGLRRAAAEYGFSESQPLNTDAFSDNDLPDPAYNWDYVPSIATNGAGVWLAAWISFNSLPGAPNPGHDSDIHCAKSTDNGVSWSAPRLLNSDGVSDSAWNSDHIRALAWAGSHRWIAVWDSATPLPGDTATDYDIHYAISENDGDSWTSPGLVNSGGMTDTTNDAGATLATDGLGVWLCAWHCHYDSSRPDGGPGTGIAYARSIDNGATWGEQQIVTPPNGPSGPRNIYPQVAHVSGGHWFVIWVSSLVPGTGLVGGNLDILISHSQDNGLTFGSPQYLLTSMATDSGDDSYVNVGIANLPPRIAIGSDGSAAIIYSTKNPPGGNIGYDADTVCATSADQGLNWDGPWIVNSNASCDTVPDFSTPDFNPVIAADGSNYVAVWVTLAFSPLDHRNTGIAISRSSDQGRHWAPMRPIHPTQMSDLYGLDDTPALATDGKGTWICAWTSNQAAVGGGGGGLSDFEVAFSRSTNLGPFVSPAINQVEQLLGQSNLGCDLNGDGVIDVADVLYALRH